MHGFAFVFLGLTLAADPIELPRDVVEMDSRKFAIPLRLDPDHRAKIEKLRLFVSEDQGKTWKHKKDYESSEPLVVFTADRDGQYWFALQYVFKDGERKPAKLDGLVPQLKVYVNAERKPLKVQKSYEEL